jgi:hypothetical protein
LPSAAGAKIVSAERLVWEDQPAVGSCLPWTR